MINLSSYFVSFYLFPKGKNYPNVFFIFITVFSIWSCGNQAKQSSTDSKQVLKEEIKKESCEDVIANIEKKAFLKDLKVFKFDSLNLMKFDEKSRLTQFDFDCLGLKGKIWKGFQYENPNKATKNQKRVFKDIDTIRFTSMYIHSFSKTRDIQYFITISPAGDGATRMFLFTISPESKKVADIAEVAYVFGDMGYNAIEQSKILNDSTFKKDLVLSHLKLIKKTDAVEEIYLKETSKFLISKTGEIKLLNHQVLINKKIE